jgi:hypothetical protein
LPGYTGQIDVSTARPHARACFPSVRSPRTPRQLRTPERNAYSAFSSSVISETDDFASPNSIAVFSP